jgi:hypothetical protein
MFIAALFIIAKLWKQLRCPITIEWIKKMWYIYIYIRMWMCMCVYDQDQENVIYNIYIYIYIYISVLVISQIGYHIFALGQPQTKILWPTASSVAGIHRYESPSLACR